MSLWAFIPGKHIVSIGLPERAQRLDTNQWVDLSGGDAGRAQACGYWDLDNIDLPTFVAANNLSQQELSVLVSERQTARQARDNLAQFVTKVHALTDSARDQNWDWIDAYCDTTVGQFPLVREQSPNAGALWGGLSTFDKAERLRLGISMLMVDLIRVTQAIDLILDWCAGQMANASLAPPPDR